MLLLLVVLVTRPIVKAIKALSESAKQVEKGNYTATLFTDRSDEVGQLQTRFNKMMEGLQQRDLIQRLFGRYVGDSVATELHQKPRKSQLGRTTKDRHDPHGRLARASLPWQNNLQPPQVVRLLNRYLSKMTEVIESHKGVIVDFYGDGILAFFDGSDSGLPERAMDAVAAACCMQSTLLTVSEDNLSDGLPELSMGNRDTHR